MGFEWVGCIHYPFRANKTGPSWFLPTLPPLGQMHVRLKSPVAIPVKATCLLLRKLVWRRCQNSQSLWKVRVEAEPENLRRPKVCRAIFSRGCPASTAVEKKPSLRRDSMSWKPLLVGKFRVKVKLFKSELLSHKIKVKSDRHFWEKNKIKWSKGISQKSSKGKPT